MILAFTKLNGAYCQLWGCLLARGVTPLERLAPAQARFATIWDDYVEAVSGVKSAGPMAYYGLRRLYLDLLAVADSYDAPHHRHEPGRVSFDERLAAADKLMEGT